MANIKLFNDELLITTYNKAVELNLDSYLIEELRNELIKRELVGSFQFEFENNLSQ